MPASFEEPTGTSGRPAPGYNDPGQPGHRLSDADAGGFAGGAPPLRADPPPAHARRTDPETSHEAAASLKPSKIKDSQHAIRQLLLVRGPMTDEQMVEEYRFRCIEPLQSESGLRSRRAELVTMNLVRWTSKWWTAPKRRRARIWEAIE